MASLFAAAFHASLLSLFSGLPRPRRRRPPRPRDPQAPHHEPPPPSCPGGCRGPGRGSIPDEWGERSPSGAPEPPAKPDPPIDEDQWGPDVAEGDARPVVIDEWGKPEAKPPSAADLPSPTAADKWEKEPEPEPEAPTPAPAPSAEEWDEQAERREDLKRCLVDTAYGSDLGFRASTEVRGEVVELVT
ncbi:hypothetical protein U9M48_006865 [Paspalum notatum var. saurae]|uniref:Uncharacterized protein n=1 Tax=Paspalum notatum var. saurae TaxID=547442 RepID=A0AAQ3Q0L1_PASNO